MSVCLVCLAPVDRQAFRDPRVMMESQEIVVPVDIEGCPVNRAPMDPQGQLARPEYKANKVNRVSLAYVDLKVPLGKKVAEVNAVVQGYRARLGTPARTDLLGPRGLREMAAIITGTVLLLRRNVAIIIIDRIR